MRIKNFKCLEMVTVFFFFFFFNCLSLAFHGDFSKASYYRNLICQKIIQKWDCWKDLAFISHDLRVNSVTQYWHDMVNKNGWATVCEIKAACDLLNINIQTWLKGFVFNRELRTYQHTLTLESYKSNQSSTTTITLLLWGEHFTPLTEIHSLEMNQEVNASDNRDTLQQQTQQQTAATSTKRKQQNVTEEKIPSKKSKTKPRTMLWQTKTPLMIKKHAFLQRTILLRSLICFSGVENLAFIFRLPHSMKQKENIRSESNETKTKLQQQRSFTSQQKNCHHHPLYQKMVTSIRSWTACEHLK